MSMAIVAGPKAKATETPEPPWPLELSAPCLSDPPWRLSFVALSCTSLVLLMSGGGGGGLSHVCSC